MLEAVLVEGECATHLLLFQLVGGSQLDYFEFQNIQGELNICTQASLWSGGLHTSPPIAFGIVIDSVCRW